jgi:hypothetical protein
VLLLAEPHREILAGMRVSIFVATSRMSAKSSGWSPSRISGPGAAKCGRGKKIDARKIPNELARHRSASCGDIRCA